MFCAEHGFGEELTTMLMPQLMKVTTGNRGLSSALSYLHELRFFSFNASGSAQKVDVVFAIVGIEKVLPSCRKIAVCERDVSWRE